MKFFFGKIFIGDGSWICVQFSCIHVYTSFSHSLAKKYNQLFLSLLVESREKMGYILGERKAPMCLYLNFPTLIFTNPQMPRTAISAPKIKEVQKSSFFITWLQSTVRGICGFNCAWYSFREKVPPTSVRLRPPLRAHTYTQLVGWCAHMPTLGPGQACWGQASSLVKFSLQKTLAWHVTRYNRGCSGYFFYCCRWLFIVRLSTVTCANLHLQDADNVVEEF